MVREIATHTPTHAATDKIGWRSPRSACVANPAPMAPTMASNNIEKPLLIPVNPLGLARQIKGFQHYNHVLCIFANGCSCMLQARYACESCIRKQIIPADAAASRSGVPIHAARAPIKATVAAAVKVAHGWINNASRPYTDNSRRSVLHLFVQLETEVVEDNFRRFCMGLQTCKHVEQAQHSQPRAAQAGV